MLKKTALEYSVLTALPMNCSDFRDNCKGRAVLAVHLPHQLCFPTEDEAGPPEHTQSHTEPHTVHTMFCKTVKSKVWLLLSENYSRSCDDSTLAICSDRGYISFLPAVRQLPSHSTDSLYLKRDTIASTDQQEVSRWRTSSLESSH